MNGGYPSGQEFTQAPSSCCGGSQPPMSPYTYAASSNDAMMQDHRMPKGGTMPQGTMPMTGAMTQGVSPMTGTMAPGAASMAPAVSMAPSAAVLGSGLAAGTPVGQGVTYPGAVPSEQPATGPLTPLTPFNQPMPVTVTSMQYINGFLRTMIGRKVTIDFLIGTNTLTDKTGTLLGVGANYILLNEIETDDVLVCDFYTIKFVRIYG